MFWLISRGVVWPVRAATGGFKLGFRTGRVVGYRRLVLVGVGAAIGLLVAPGPGAELRARLRERLDGGAGTPSPSPSPGAWPPPGGGGTLPEPVLATRSAPGPVVPGVDPEVLPHPAPVVDEAELAGPGGGHAGGEPLPAAPDADPVAERPAP